ncbi:MAG TPA: short-chain dehydrogenase, partial [Bacteroidetes bacterium]|nr:short-chain dehydrogenase [Bacteroidota bacterium]
MSTFQNKIVLITGGASGIGKLMGKAAIQKGIKHLVIWDINKKMLDETVQEFSVYFPDVHGYVVDVSDKEQIQSISKQVKNDIGTIDILINNAGIVIGKYFHEHTHTDIDRTMSINADALMHITLEFLPDMIQRNSGHIVNIASAAGLVGNPKMSVYAASK